MKITKLTSQKRDTSRVNMYIDDQFFCGISLNTVAKYSMYVGKELEEIELDKIFKDEIRGRFLERAMSYLSRSVKTEYQVKRYTRDLSVKQKGKWYVDISKESVEDIVSFVLKKLNEYGYTDDKNFATLFVQSRIKTKPRGKTVLISELISKGVSKDIAVETVNELIEDESTILKRVYEKKFKNGNISFNDRKKIDFLRRKGFSWDLIENLINNELTK
ncbi:MAG: RecX family transcriptional regulator [Candidatus Dojkabacteria bacterium]